MVGNIIVDSRSGTCQIFVSKQQIFRFISSISLFILAIEIWGVEFVLNEENHGDMGQLSLETSVS
jgi:hypothetical protein